MEFKLGGGRHMQPYDPENGQYTDEDALIIGEKDMENLVLVYLFGMDYDHLVFHFPNYKIHNEDYCEMFVKYIRRFIKNEDAIVETRKIEYLLSVHYQRDKSSFLNKIGYNRDNVEQLIEDIRWNTDFQTATFKTINNFTFNFKAKTTINNYVVTTAWQLSKNGDIRLITLIPGGDKKWK